MDAVALAATALGGALTGLLSVGIGESVVPQPTRRGDVLLAVAAGTSVSWSSWSPWRRRRAQASVVQNVSFPEIWCHRAVGDACGGQIGPRLQGAIAQRDAERALGAVFVCVGAAFLKAGLEGR